jgi:gallate decarboxylase subunit D
MTTDDVFKTFLITEQKGGLEVHAQVNSLGPDLEVNLLGGDMHIGAVGLAEARPSLSDPQKTSATGSVFTFLSHKEDEIVKPMAEELAKKLNRKVVVVAGIHWDWISSEGIEAVRHMCRRITDRIVEEVLKR